MTRSRRVGAAAPSSVVVTAAPPGTDGEDTPTAQAADTLSELEDEGRRRAEARIFRLDPLVRKMALLDTVDASQADESYVKETYGGGQYSVQFWGPRTDGSWGYLKKESKTFVIDSSVPFKGSPRDRAINPPAPTAAVPAGSSILDMGMLQLLSGFQENSKAQAAMQRDHSAAMMAMMERLAAPRGGMDIEKVLLAIGPVVAPLIAGLVNRKDPVELATQIAALSRSEKTGLGSLHELIELKDALGILSGNNADSEEGGWFRIFEKVLPGAVEILKNESAKTGRPMQEIARQPVAAARTLAAGTAHSPASTSPLPASASSAGAPSPSAGTEPVADEWSGLEPHMETLANFAAQAKDPYDVVKMVKLIAPASVWAAIRELIARDDAVIVLTTRFPVLAPYQAWTADLLSSFYDEIYPDADDEEEGSPGAETVGEGEPSDGITS